MEAWIADNMTWVLSALGTLAVSLVVSIWTIARLIYTFSSTQRSNTADIKQIREEVIPKLEAEDEKLHARISEKDKEVTQCMKETRKELGEVTKLLHYIAGKMGLNEKD